MWRCDVETLKSLVALVRMTVFSIPAAVILTLGVLLFVAAFGQEKAREVFGSIGE